MKQSRRKSGLLSHGAKVPDKGLGLDWDAIREARAKRLDEEIARGVDNAETREHLLSKEEQDRLYRLRVEKALKPSKSPKPSRNSGEGKAGRPRNTPKYDVDEIVRLYVEEELPPKEIVERLGGTPSYGTVINYLKKRQVFDVKKFRTGGPKGKPLVRPKESYSRQQHCGVCGADLDVPGNSRERMDANGNLNGRECVPCARRRSSTHRTGNGDG